MSSREVMVKAAAALRELAEENEKLAESNKLFAECVKLAFDMAKIGQIDSDPDSIIKKAHDLMTNQNDIPVIKKALEFSSNYDFLGDLEKKGSMDSDYTAEDVFASVLRGA